jgi:peptidoglycan/xylan/chitin deacetylase (PgdA/CDA1 family)
VALAVVAAVVGVGIASRGGRSGNRWSAPASAALLASGTAPIEVPTVDHFHGPVPILMYHAISPAPVGNPSPGLFVPEAEFEQQITWLAQQGYHAVTLDEVFAAWHDDKPIAANPIVISFDDGLRSQYEGARPILTRLGWRAVLNLEINNVEDGELPESMVRDLIKEGWEVDSHTFTHPDLTAVDPGALKREVAGSRQWLHRRFHVPVDFFCYPAGDYDATVVSAVKAAGYEGATTTEPGFATASSDRFTLRRIRVDPEDEIDGLAAKLQAG